MSRRTKKRRAGRRARQAREALKPVPAQPERPVDWDRLHQRYRSMEGRGVSLSYVLCGPLIKARNSAELERNTAAALAHLLKDEPQN